MSHYYSYGPPPPQPARFYQPPPPPAPMPYYMDPVTFRRDYASRLADLTVNSRPIIQSLSMLAQDYSRFADTVAHCIESHIRSVPPWMKLPAFYLLDAISKNVYEPYAQHFVSFVVPLFLETYNLVDGETRHKMEEMLITWRNGSPQGRALFGSANQYAIERGIWGDSSQRQNDPPRITKAQVLSELEFVLSQKEQALQASPYDKLARDHVAVLHQLRLLVETGVSSNDLQQILQRLRSLSRAPAQPAPQSPLVVVPPVQQWSQTTLPPALATPSQPQSFSPPIPPQSEPSQTVPTSAPPVNISELLSSLIKSGVVPSSSSGTPVNPPEKSPEPPVDLERESARAYRQSVLSRPVTLTVAGIAKLQPQITEFLYDHLSSQCKQCGLRFADNTAGKQELDDHLDMHFRQNRKANQDIGRGHSRSWFVTVDDWIHDMTSSRKGKGKADSSRPLNPKEAAAAEAAKREADLRAQYVVVPPGDEAKHIYCSICKEQMKSEFLEDDEDWVWKNAVMKENKLYHATCHAEALTSNTSLAARLRNDLTGQTRSRSGTPERRLPSVSGSSTTPPPGVRKKSESPVPESSLAGVKRKAETSDSLDLPDSSPALKKVALS